MLEGIQFHLELGETTTTSCSFGNLRRRCSAAVCPETPAPKITTRAIAVLLLEVAGSAGTRRSGRGAIHNHARPGQPDGARDLRPRPAGRRRRPPTPA